MVIIYFCHFYAGDICFALKTSSWQCISDLGLRRYHDGVSGRHLYTTQLMNEVCNSLQYSTATFIVTVIVALNSCHFIITSYLVLSYLVLSFLVSSFLIKS